MSHKIPKISRLRVNATLRDMLAENSLSANDLIQPVFIHYGEKLSREIPSMPGQYQFSIDRACEYVREIHEYGIKAIILFGIPEHKDDIGSESFNDNGIIQQAVRAIKQVVPQMYIITDVCFCEYTSHGHCGFMNKTSQGMILDHKVTCAYLERQVVSHAQAGADMVAPSGMIDGQVAAIRYALDCNGFINTPIMSYAAKYASAFYGPFRDAAQGAPVFGDRRTHQMNSANSDEALREVAQDIAEGADIVMVKPGLAYLDIIRRVKDNFNIPIVGYNVSGEYAMVKAAAANGWLDEPAIVAETLLAFKRAGADLIISYHSADFLKACHLCK